jgi:hypothetical protein
MGTYESGLVGGEFLSQPEKRLKPGIIPKQTLMQFRGDPFGVRSEWQLVKA